MAHHPDFVRFATAFQQGRFEAALTLVDGLLAEFEQEPWLHWHRANTLEKLERFDQVLPELDAVLALNPAFVPAIVKRVRYAFVARHVPDEEDEILSEADLARRERQQAELANTQSFLAEAELRRALSLQSDYIEGLSALSQLLRHRDGDAAALIEADELLDRAIALAPSRIELLETRASIHRSAAILCDEAHEGAPDDPDTVHTFGGMRFSRRALEAALADYTRCYVIGRRHRHAVRMGSLLHDLGRFDEALECFDEALSRMPVNDPARAFIVETRARSENNGAGEREQMAALLESTLQDDGKERSLQEDMAAQTILGAARAMRAGRSVARAIQSQLSNDPETMMATSIAQQILNLAHEPPPGLVEIESRDYPAYQRRFANRVSAQIASLGLYQVADGEAKGLFPMLGQRVLIRFFADDSGEVGVAAFALKPKWPGWLGFLLMLLMRKWKVTTMVECVTQFDDGTLLSTQHESPSPFQYGGAVQIERVSRSMSVAELVSRHLQRVDKHKKAHRGSVALVAKDLEGMDRRWREGQRVKQAYRASVGYVTETELRALLGAQHEKFGPKVRSQVALLAADYS